MLGKTNKQSKYCKIFLFNSQALLNSLKQFSAKLTSIKYMTFDPHNLLNFDKDAIIQKNLIIHQNDTVTLFVNDFGETDTGMSYCTKCYFKD